MILNDTITIKTTNKNIKYFRSIGFYIKSGDSVVIKPEQLLKGSHFILQVSCDNCNNIMNMKYKTYYLLTNGMENSYYCNKCKVMNYQRTKDSLVSELKLNSSL